MLFKEYKMHIMNNFGNDDWLGLVIIEEIPKILFYLISHKNFVFMNFLNFEIIYFFCDNYRSKPFLITKNCHAMYFYIICKINMFRIPFSAKSYFYPEKFNHFLCSHFLRLDFCSKTFRINII